MTPGDSANREACLQEKVPDVVASAVEAVADAQEAAVEALPEPLQVKEPEAPPPPPKKKGFFPF